MTYRKIISVLLALVLLACSVPFAFASENEKIPFVLVHGMMGWGENDEAQTGRYWGFGEDADVPAYLRSLGYEVAVPSLGKMSSAWDRACELYAQLAGTVVDYGAAHSEKHGHARFGRDYTGRGLLEKAWNADYPVNLITHSFGGPTAIVFTSVLEYGAEEEVAASPEDCSEFFRGGHAGAVNAVFACESPSNGSQMSDFMMDIPGSALLIAFISNLLGTQAAPKMDFMFDQWGITADPHEGKTASFNPMGIMRLAMTKDHAGYDMTLKGAKELNERFPAAENTYYISYTARNTTDALFGLQVATGTDILSLMANGTALLANKYYLRSGWVGNEWAANDGLVPVVSALYPFNARHAEYVSGDSCEKGVWYYTPVIECAGHGAHVGGTKDVLFAKYDDIVSVADCLA